jgi:hypothetical protein
MGPLKHAHFIAVRAAVAEPVMGPLKHAFIAAVRAAVVEPVMGPLTHAHNAAVRAAVSEPHPQASYSATEYNIRCTAYGRVHGHETDDADGRAVATAVAKPELRSESRIVGLSLQQRNTCDRS